MAENNWTINDSLPADLAQEFAAPASPSTPVYWGGPSSLAFEAAGAPPQTVIVPVATVAASANTPTVTLGALSLSVPVATVTVSSLTPTVSPGAVSISVVAASVTALAISPTVSLGTVSIAVPAAETGLSGLSGGVVLGTVAVGVPAVTTNLFADAPFAETDQVIAVDAIDVTVEAIAPDVVTGTPQPLPYMVYADSPRRQPQPVSVTVSDAECRAEAVAPTISLGSFAVKSVGVGIYVKAVAPRVSLGAIKVAPSPVSFKMEAIPPAALTSELIKIGDVTLYVHPDLSMSLIVPDGVSVDVEVMNGEVLA